ncbi:MAG: hypothetical protein V7K98_16560 [Nostoc sp.]|uniref:hypothetical protein n=1 Tax=Nostoc sp. TaxID=1180 RepID=UPI002FF8D722
MALAPGLRDRRYQLYVALVPILTFGKTFFDATKFYGSGERREKSLSVQELECFD